jgi:hypothetical protein
VLLVFFLSCLGPLFWWRMLDLGGGAWRDVESRKGGRKQLGKGGKLTSVGLLKRRFRSNALMALMSSASRSKSVTWRFASRRDWLLDLGMTARPRWVAQLWGRVLVVVSLRRRWGEVVERGG